MTVADLDALAAALAPPPGDSGGPMLLLAAGTPDPAVAVVSTGEAHFDGTLVRLALLRSSSAARALPDWCVLVAPHAGRVLRVHMEPRRLLDRGPLRVLEAAPADIRPTSEPPWEAHLRFHAPAPDERTATHVRYWGALRAWLEAGAEGAPPPPPMTTA